MTLTRRRIAFSRGVSALFLPALVANFGAGTVFAGGTAGTFEEALEWIYADREEVISGRELLALMDTGTIRDEVYLLDIRSPEEWEVSRLQDASAKRCARRGLPPCRIFTAGSSCGPTTVFRS